VASEMPNGRWLAEGGRGGGFRGGASVPPPDSVFEMRRSMSQD